MCESCYERNDSNPARAVPRRADVDTSLNAQTEGECNQHQRKCTGFQSFLEQQDLCMY